ncbi:unnamed protein product [Protopolystoma xenopodis]|uniref:EF-hand domain-containing protein n=1 Tax=Protopolystoma xenopodis TaxID=117903 RepID=A0A3S5B745_9PLAT|nr:unnamed protein product [Protopolystoma xenopodis]
MRLHFPYFLSVSASVRPDAILRPSQPDATSGLATPVAGYSPDKLPGDGRTTDGDDGNIVGSDGGAKLRAADTIWTSRGTVGAGDGRGELRSAVEWKFFQLDVDHDHRLSTWEFRPLRRQLSSGWVDRPTNRLTSRHQFGADVVVNADGLLVPLDPDGCRRRLFRRCDLDRSDWLDRDEWSACIIRGEQIDSVLLFPERMMPLHYKRQLDYKTE